MVQPRLGAPIPVFESAIAQPLRPTCAGGRRELPELEPATCAAVRRTAAKHSVGVSRYARRLADLPWPGRPVRLPLEVRKFFCDEAACPRPIFAERVPQSATARARQTSRLAQALVGIAFACGGEGRARLAHRLGMPTSPGTLLRRIPQTQLVARGTPRVLGVDDWALRRGRRCGTILCDLEQRCPLELPPERSAETLAVWLAGHPGIEISRHRPGYYAQGARLGAPQATRPADR